MEWSSVAWLGGHLRCCRKKHFHQLNSYSLEFLLLILLSLKNLYNPTNVLLNFKNYILSGDLNARTKQKGCVVENENDITLERLINE
ncbi:hypothetical protein BpHYR1_003000 [Brachionus plicatilis]|uniref:Uncharacterized protein n=1 Tax=Brachionus plicatilis TaxID=10195 RepID=A0A3M7RIV1_BRAPC|nr:hypothetical protein BpHYR1_003000 [Brachionus plicatilis]